MHDKFVGMHVIVMRMSVPQLYEIDTDHEFTAAGVGIPRRRPRLTTRQRERIRLQLENGGCLAAFEAGIHGVRDAVHPRSLSCGSCRPTSLATSSGVITRGSSGSPVTGATPGRRRGRSSRALQGDACHQDGATGDR